jgi:hypothetical protein
MAWVAASLLASGAVCASPAGAQEINLSGLQVWNADYWQTTSLGDYMGSNYNIRKLKPISLVGCRNGSFSGYIVTTCSTGPTIGLKATITDLAEATGKKISADRVLIRYPDLARADTSWAPPYRFDRMLDRPPEEVKVVDLRQWRDWKPRKEGPIAMQPIWVTVRVPTNAAPGDYEGVLTVEAENNKPYAVPVRLTVHDWALPDPRNYTVQNMGWLNPERVAMYYGLPMWSDKHFELLGQSLELMLPLGSRHVEANLVLRYWSRDNRETMVKWIKKQGAGVEGQGQQAAEKSKPEGSGKTDTASAPRPSSPDTFAYDFTVFDKYMDVVARIVGKPSVVRLNMWSAMRNPCHPVVVVDPASGKTEELVQPMYGTPESYAFWKPVLDQIRTRMDKRGWFDVTTVGWHNYCGGPDSNTVSVLKRIWPDGKWAQMDHGGSVGFKGVAKEDWMPVLAGSTVWGEFPMKPRGYKGVFKPGGPYFCAHARGRVKDWSSLWDVRVVVEEIIMKGKCGVDPMAGDFWMIQDERGRWGAYAEWGECQLGPRVQTQAMLGPGPKGPVATERYEAWREGVQICEAILFIQRGLDAGSLDAALTERANKVLDDRSKHRIDCWVLANKSGKKRFDPATAAENAPEREHQLYAVAAEVAKAMKK